MYLTGVIVNLNVESESIIVSLMEHAVGDFVGTKPTLVIHIYSL